jgi:hypothetical protein
MNQRMSAALPDPMPRLRLGPRLATAASVLLHGAIALVALRLSPLPAQAPLSGAAPLARSWLPIDVVATDEVPAPAPANPAAEARQAEPVALPLPAAPPPPRVVPPAAGRPRNNAVSAPRAEARTAAPEGEDWLGLNRRPTEHESDHADAKEHSRTEPRKPSHHEALIARLAAAEHRKALAREEPSAAIPAPETPASANRPSPSAAAAVTGAPTAQPSLSATARKLQSAQSLAQATAWTIPYASATDPIWEHEGSVGGELEIELTLADGRVKSIRVQGEPPAHLRRLADGIAFYLQQGYRARAGQSADGKHAVRIVVRVSAGPKNQSLGFDPEHARSHFTLISGRRVDATVSEERTGR